MFKTLTEEKLINHISYNPPPNDFYNTLRQRIHQYLDSNHLQQQDDPGMFMKTFVQLGLWAGAYACMLSDYFHGWALFGWQLLFHFSMFLMSVGIAHDGSHGAYSSRPWLNKLTYRVFDLIGINSHMWEYNHNLSHHYVPNIPLYDSAIDSFVLFRFHPKSAWHPFHRYQHWYIFVIYAFSTLFKIFFLDFYSFSRKRIGMIAVNKPTWKDISYLLFTKAVVIGYTLVIPILLIHEPAWQIIVGFIAGNFLMGITLGIVFQVTHLSDHTVFTEPDATGRVSHSFPEHILKTTADFCADNKLITWISGGLNLHVAHHLFPRISQQHLPAITKLVKQTAAEYGLVYKEYPTVLAALQSHLRLLRQLGSKEHFAASEWPLRQYPVDRS